MIPMPNEKALRERPPGMYVVNEVFYSVQGEGVLAGTPMVFIRFADCNLRCATTNAGFDCDTEFASGRVMTRAELGMEIVRSISRRQTKRDTAPRAEVVEWLARGGDVADMPSITDADRSRMPKWFLLTGGEPALQVTSELVAWLKTEGAQVAIETNGTLVLPDNIDHVCVSPKSAEHTLRQLRANEVKYVRRDGQAIPETRVTATHHLISPACQPDGSFCREDVEWCVQLVIDNPMWRLSMQQHKIWGVR